MSQRVCFYEIEAGNATCPACVGQILHAVIAAEEPREKKRLKELRQNGFEVGVCVGHERYAEARQIKLA
jgi:hypothetical protein